MSKIKSALTVIKSTVGKISVVLKRLLKIASVVSVFGIGVYGAWYAIKENGNGKPFYINFTTGILELLLGILLKSHITISRLSSSKNGTCCGAE